MESLAHKAKEHWKNVRPRMYAELKASGKLDELAQAAARSTREAVAALVEKGWSDDQAWEAVREDWVFLPSEEDLPNLGENPDSFPDPANPLPTTTASQKRMTKNRGPS